MGTAARLFLLFFCGLLLSAHFLRWGNFFLAMASLLFPAIVFFRSPWARIAAWVFCGFGAITWATVAQRFIAERMLAGEPWTRLAVILGAVASVNLLAGALLCGARMRSWFRLPERASD